MNFLSTIFIYFMACVIKNNNLKMQKKDWVDPNVYCKIKLATNEQIKNISKR